MLTAIFFFHSKTFHRDLIYLLVSKLRSVLLLPHWDGGLPWCHPIRAHLIGLAQTLLGGTQAHKAEFSLTPGAHQASTVALAVFQQRAADGTSADGGAAVDALHVREVDGFAVLQDVQRTLAGFAFAAF